MVEYPTYKAPFEELTTIDERVDYIHKQVADVQVALNTILEKEGEPAVGVVTRNPRLRHVVQPQTGQRIWAKSPLTGRITQIIPHFPDGCNSHVDVAFGHSDTWVMPPGTDTFIALNDATPVINVSEPVIKGEELWMIVNNGDAVNTHAITIAITVIGVP